MPVLRHKADSIHDDVPDVAYDFPRAYLKAIQEAVGDWAVHHEPVKAGPRGYFAVARIAGVIPQPGVPGRYPATIAPGSFRPFDREVPRQMDGPPLEAALAGSDGALMQGGAVQLSVRRMPAAGFARIVGPGLPADVERIEETRNDPQPPGLDDGAAPFARPVLERRTRRAYRDVAFRRTVRAAYGFRCAMSGLMLRNGGGRPEVRAARIRPVAEGGSGSPRNGLALSGTLHWLFDRGRVAVAEDGATILVSRDKVPGDVVARLLAPGARLIPPADPRDAPHPDNLRWHRERVFGRAVGQAEAPWG